MPRNASMPCTRPSLCPAVALALLCALPVQGRTGAETVGQGEFPGLQFLPPGSVLKGISLPRYEGHRVTALFTAGTMEVKSRSLVALSALRVHLYDRNGETTDLDSAGAHYDFARSQVTSPTQTRLVSPRMEAQGVALIFDTKRSIGILKGPVNTAIRMDKAHSGKK